MVFTDTTMYLKFVFKIRIKKYIIMPVWVKINCLKQCI